MYEIIGNHKMVFSRKEIVVIISTALHFKVWYYTVCTFMAVYGWGLGLILKYIKKKNWPGAAVNRKLNVHYLLTNHADRNLDEASYLIFLEQHNKRAKQHSCK